MEPQREPQKSVMINGKEYTAKKVQRLFTTKTRTIHGNYIVEIEGREYFAFYHLSTDRDYRGKYSRKNADVIVLWPEEYRPGDFPIWLYL